MSVLDRIVEACSVRSNRNYCITSVKDLVTADNTGKVMPPTYKKGSKEEVGAEYHIEDRYIDDKRTMIVVLDSYQSAANRLEEAVHEAWEDGEFDLPTFPEIEISVNNHKECYSVFDLPHRIFSAHFKLSEDVNKKRFMDLPLGKKLYHSNDAVVQRAVFDCNPFAILLGCWRSHVDDVKVNRARAFRMGRSMVMEVVGGEPIQTYKSGGMLVPIEFPKPEKEEGKKNPSEMGLGSTPPTISSVGGVSVKWVKEYTLLPVNALFNYCTGDKKHDVAARTMMVCMGLYAHTLRRKKEYSLRSNCLLRRDDEVNLYKWNGKEEFTLTVEEAKKLYYESAGRVSGLDINRKVLKLYPDKDLTKMVDQAYTSKNELKTAEELRKAKKKKKEGHEE